MPTPLQDKSRYQLVASDLDGTLLAPDHKLSAFTLATLKELHDKGFTFIFATGRHHVDVASIRQSAGIPAYMITSNGARVHDQNDNLMYSKNVPEDLVQSIVDVVKNESDIFIHIYQNESWLLSQEDESLKQFNKDSGFHYTLFDAQNTPTDGLAKIFFTHQGREHERLAEIETALNEKFGDTLNVAFSTPWCLEVMSAEVSKGNALQAVAESLGKGLENCIAFGDGMNDVELLSMAGKGLVMGTAHHRVFEALPNNEVIGANADDAVAHYLKDHLF
ncbi:Cof-type HAD-IIB family hydrolase [Vibrio maerlii]|uniref:Cof-type HAD-IIB family hydrolase n=1 Tax=Vibrio maerlii TaxID=2231648 RepID=UPI000E3D3DEF|nr:Cof-type HAD-IIB family hydrolase [Vibrio maerlii]